MKVISVFSLFAFLVFAGNAESHSVNAGLYETVDGGVVYYDYKSKTYTFTRSTEMIDAFLNNAVSPDISFPFIEWNDDNSCGLEYDDGAFIIAIPKRNTEFTKNQNLFRIEKRYNSKKFEELNSSEYLNINQYINGVIARYFTYKKGYGITVIYKYDHGTSKIDAILSAGKGLLNGCDG